MDSSLTDGLSGVMARTAVLIDKTSVCADCLASRLGRRRVEISKVLQRIAERVRFRTNVGRCVHCSHEKVVHRIR